MSAVVNATLFSQSSISLKMELYVGFIVSQGPHQFWCTSMTTRTVSDFSR